MSWLKQSPDITPKHLKIGAAILPPIVLALLIPGPDGLKRLRTHIDGRTEVILREYAGDDWRSDSASARSLTLEQADRELADLVSAGWIRENESTRGMSSKLRMNMEGSYDERIQFTSPDRGHILRVTMPMGRGATQVSSVRHLGMRERARLWFATTFTSTEVFEGRP